MRVNKVARVRARGANDASTLFHFFFTEMDESVLSTLNKRLVVIYVQRLKLSLRILLSKNQQK